MKFFIPLAESIILHESLLSKFVQQHMGADSSLFKGLRQVIYRNDGDVSVATVGEEFSIDGCSCGMVLAILSSERYVTIHTQLRGVLLNAPVLVGKDEVLSAQPFDEQPEHPSRRPKEN